MRSKRREWSDHHVGVVGWDVVPAFLAFCSFAFPERWCITDGFLRKLPDGGLRRPCEVGLFVEAAADQPVCVDLPRRRGV